MAFEYRGIIQAVKDLGLYQHAPSPSQVLTGVHAKASEHYAGRAVDWGQSNNDPAAIYAALVPYAQGDKAAIDELFYDPSGHGWKNGQDIGPVGGHSDHVHVGVRAGVNLSEVIKGKQSGGGYPWYDPRSYPIVGKPIEKATDVTREGVEVTKFAIDVIEWVSNPANLKRIGMAFIAFLIGLEALVMVKKGLET